MPLFGYDGIFSFFSLCEHNSNKLKSELEAQMSSFAQQALADEQRLQQQQADHDVQVHCLLERCDALAAVLAKMKRKSSNELLRSVRAL